MQENYIAKKNNKAQIDLRQAFVKGRIYYQASGKVTNTQSNIISQTQALIDTYTATTHTNALTCKQLSI